MKRLAVLLALPFLVGCPGATPPAPSPTPAILTPAPTGNPAQEAFDLLQQGQLKGARTLAERAVATSPNDPTAHQVLSEVEFSAGNYDRALEEAEAARKLAPDSPMPLLALVRAQTFVDPEAALGTAREMHTRSKGVHNAVLLADATLYAATSRGESGPAARKTAEEARKLLAPFAESIKSETQMRGDYLAVLGNTYLLERDLPKARKTYEEALKYGAGLHDRVTDVATALAWVCFLEGDEKGTERYLDIALAELRKASASDAFGLLPKWESYSLMRLAFTGKAVTQADLRRMQTQYDRMQEQGFQDLVSYREDRRLQQCALDAWERSDYGQAFYVMAGRVLEVDEGGAQGAVRLTQSGEKRLEPNCFYNVTVERPAHKMMGPMLMAMIAQKAKRPDLAAWWYREALKRQPGNPIATKRLKALGKTKEPPADLGSPDPGATLKILQRMQQEGWSELLLEGMETLWVRGITQAEMEKLRQENDPRYQRIAGVLDQAVAAVDRGAKFEYSKGDVPPADRQGYGEKDWWAEGEATLDYGGPKPLRMHKEDNLWRITGFAEDGATD